MPLRLARPHAQWNGDWLPGTVRSRLNVIRDSGCHPRFRTTPFRRLQHGYDPLDVRTRSRPTCRRQLAARPPKAAFRRATTDRERGPGGGRGPRGPTRLVPRELAICIADQIHRPCQAAAVELTIRWYAQLGQPFVTQYRLELDGVYAGTIE